MQAQSRSRQRPDCRWSSSKTLTASRPPPSGSTRWALGSPASSRVTQTRCVRQTAQRDATAERLKPSRFLVASDPLKDGSNGRVTRVVMSCRSGEIRVLSEATWRLIESGKLSELPAEAVNDLRSIEAIVDETQDELALQLARNATAAQAAELHYLVVQPTAACQLGCGYCGQTHRAKLMSAEHQDALVARTIAQL